MSRTSVPMSQTPAMSQTSASSALPAERGGGKRHQLRGSVPHHAPSTAKDRGEAPEPHAFLLNKELQNKYFHWHER